MDRVLQRVGLSRRGPPQEQTLGPGEELVKVRRRRRRGVRQEAKSKPRGLFNIDWESVKDCRSCKSRAITRKFCSKRCDNEVYRSNSFKFERFVRGADEASTLDKKIAICDDYSLPVDNVGSRKRPNSIAVPTFIEWKTISPNEEKVEILETYSTPRDSKKELVQEEPDTKYFTSPDREYSQPYTTEGSSEPTSDDDFHLPPKPKQLNSPDSLPPPADAQRHPSPYYYADLYKRKEPPQPPSRKSSSASDGLTDEMTRQRHLYETAFDCKISKSDDDLEQLDKVSNHPVLIQINAPGPSTAPPKPSQEDNNAVGALAQKLQDMRLPVEEASTSLSLPLRGYTPSPPSTAPLPTKFPGKRLIMNSIRSAPHLTQKSRLKDLHLPVKSSKGKNAFEVEFGKRIAEFKGRPQQELIVKRNRKETKENVEYKSRRRRHKFSSTESMMTSSSGGSMESIKSSTSEGNRSTTSSDSRRSSSLSSHSSDSGGTKTYCTSQNCVLLSHANKLHILSPISDKSSQEPISETSDNNRNNNSQKCSPEESGLPDTLKVKRRLPQNKNLLHLGFHKADHEIQGSDSGISIQSREGIKSRLTFTAVELNSQQDLSDLPFDMPKLRRRRTVAQEGCTSSSTTSVDLRDLPFDMPKLRRRLRLQPEFSVSQASSSQSITEADRRVSSFRPKLTLNLGKTETVHRPGLGLSLVGVGLDLNQPTDVIDVNLPLEKQGWFHGAITRVEAENVLRMLREGSFLVRNSESTKQDYSLSLKSARGFMHMRIQKNGTDECYILGQFSKPFNSIPEMIRHFCINRLPIRGAEHMCLLQPVIAQLL